MKKFKYWWLLLVIILSLVLRFWQLSSIPMGFMDDEVSIGYNAYSILKTVRDEHGKFLPLVNFRAFGEYKLPLTIYLTAVFEFFFGLNEFAVRLPSALFGVLTVVMTYFLTRGIFVRKNNGVDKAEKRAFVASFFLAISPWHVFLNRFAHEANIALGLTVLGFYFLLKSRVKERYFPIGLLFLVLTLYTYHAYQLFLPFLAIVFGWRYRSWLWSLKRRSKIYSLFILLLALPLFFALFSHGQTRFRQVGIFSDSGLPSGIRKPWVLAKIFFQNYLLNFSTYSLFAPVRFDQKHVMPTGLLYLFDLPLMVLGLIHLLKKKNASVWFLLVWLLLFPVPDSLTHFGAIARMFVWLPWPQILAAVGLLVLWQQFTKRRELLKVSLFFLLALTIFFSWGQFALDYYLDYPIKYARFSQAGRKATFNYLEANGGHYPAVLVNVQAVNHLQLAFFDQTDPQEFRENRDGSYCRSCGEINQGLENCSNRCLPSFAKIRNWYVVASFPKETIRGDELLIFPAESFPEELEPEAVINYPDGSPFTVALKANEYLVFAEGKSLP